MSVTIKDVARKAGVAPSTVSRVIHGNPKISEETQERVRQAMGVLGYHPNAAARSLARGRSYTLGLMIPNSEDDLFVKPFFIMAMRGLSIEAQRRGYNIMFSFSSGEEEEVSLLKRFVRTNVVDGVILMTSRRDDKCMAFLEEKNCPYVVIGRPESRFLHALWVDNDNVRAMYNLVAYFLKAGRRRIAFLGGPADFSVTRDRLRGYRDALKAHGVERDDSLVFLAPGFQERDGYALAGKILSGAMADAIAAADDFLALGMASYMEERGTILPIAGFNNTMKGSVIRPRLTSVDIQPELLGTRAAELLIGHLEGEDSLPPYSIVETILMERESTDPDFLSGNS